jgi:hypothetical protein
MMQATPSLLAMQPREQRSTSMSLKRTSPMSKTQASSSHAAKPSFSFLSHASLYMASLAACLLLSRASSFFYVVGAYREQALKGRPYDNALAASAIHNCDTILSFQLVLGPQGQHGSYVTSLLLMLPPGPAEPPLCHAAGGLRPARFCGACCPLRRGLGMCST